jgi:hypothetical protein
MDITATPRQGKLSEDNHLQQEQQRQQAASSNGAKGQRRR